MKQFEIEKPAKDAMKVVDNDETKSNSSSEENCSKEITHIGRCNAVWEDLTDEFKDNEYITTGYRLNHKGFKSVCCTLFKCHNETTNIWTHLLGKIAFFGIMLFILI